MSAHTSTLPTFSPPANLQELTPENRAIWSKDYVAGWMNSEIAGQIPGRTPLSQFFNGMVTPFDTTQKPLAIKWFAFPNTASDLKQKFGGLDKKTLWQIADSSRIFQDEYIEWSAKRDGSGNITTCTFTCEGPEYFQFFAQNQKEDAIKTIMHMNKDAMDGDTYDPESWFLNGNTYYPRNDDNMKTTTGVIFHLIHPSNTLGAEVDIAAQSTVIRKHTVHTPGQPPVVHDPVTNADELIRCSLFGNPDRNSDPHIGITINALCRAPAPGPYSVSIADPVALYINTCHWGTLKLDVSGAQDGSELKPLPQTWFHYQRGDFKKHQGLRFTVANPDGSKTSDGKRLLTVSDIYDTNANSSQNIRWASQFADYIEMSVSGVVVPVAKMADSLPCPGSQAATIMATAMANGAEKPEHTPLPKSLR